MDDDITEEMFIEHVVEQMESTNRDINALALLGIQATAYSNTFIVKEPCRNSPHTGWKFMMEILGGHEKRCHEMFRMEKHVFRELCDTLKGYGLKSTRGIPVEEAVGMFLMTLGHGIGNRMIQERFQHSGETVSRQFSNVLNYMSTFTMEMIKPHDNYNEVPNHIRQNPKYHPYFRDCIGAIDGTHVRASLPVDGQIPYIGRKGYPTQNIMAACDFDMLFTFVWPGWEGCAHDTRIFLNALRDPDLKFPHPPAIERTFGV
ncbi:hypothetical protein L1049_011622 [Liquidambar formosana]|uniref:DUF8040 domain-containing protein n=1 Tax=Liquidambar formosana TaxID=63359 RepID=A0AAP0RRW8_LIQFO